MIVNLTVALLGLFVFLFIFWKRLKEDYASEIIFKTAFNMVLGVAVGYLVAKKLAPEWFFYIELIGIVIGLLVSSFRLRVRLFETVEASVLGFLPWLSIFFLQDSVRNFSFTSFLGFVAILIFIFVFYYLDGHYKQFSWYGSGRVGFVGLATMALIFLSRSVVATFGITMLSFVGRYESIISGASAFICFILIYNLGRK
jgi:hypothetical protein